MKNIIRKKVQNATLAFQKQEYIWGKKRKNEKREIELCEKADWNAKQNKIKQTKMLSRHGGI